MSLFCEGCTDKLDRGEVADKDCKVCGFLAMVAKWRKAREEAEHGQDGTAVQGVQE